MSTGIYNRIMPEIEARLMNANDWILFHDDVVHLGVYAEHHHQTDSWEHYYLYMFIGKDGTMHFGAQYGFELGQYISHMISKDQNPLEYNGANRSVMVGIIRYLLFCAKWNS